MKATFQKYLLEYIKPARTSRGEMRSHTVYIVKLAHNGKTVYGEASPLPGLSIDHRDDFEEKLEQSCLLVNDGFPARELELAAFPSIRFAFETALLSLQHEHPFTVFDSDFRKGIPVAINGLVWMDSKEKMLEQAIDKITQGFTCIKFKVGALDFDEECRMLETLRKYASAYKTEIRLDANGAFTGEDVFDKLHDLARFEIHSIEQPVKPGQPDLMQEICAKSGIAVALDEELIGLNAEREGESLLKMIRPQYIILKPTLIGGFSEADQWISKAAKQETGWWATSALESNIGLNAIAQWASHKKVTMPQGLGTGRLYKNNFSSPLTINNGFLIYDRSGRWLIER